MNLRALLKQAEFECAALEAVQRGLRDTVEQGADNWKMRYVEMRREFSLCMTRLSKTSEALLPLLSDNELALEFRKALSNMRMKTSVHQASWSVVAVDFGNREYQNSLMQVEKASRDFFGVAAKLWPRGAAIAKL